MTDYMNADAYEVLNLPEETAELPPRPPFP